MSERLTLSGFRRSDDQPVVQAHNSAVAAILAHGGSPATITRRLLVLADQLRASAERVSERDLEQEGIDIADRFFARRAAGERGDGEADA